MDNKQLRYLIILIYWLFSLITWLVVSWIIINFIAWFSEVKTWILSNIHQNTSLSIILTITISFLCFKLSMYRFDNKFNHTKIRKLKEEWVALQKTAIISEFKEWYHKRRGEENEYYCYFLAFDWEKYFKSNEFDEQVKKPIWIFWKLVFKNLNINFNPNKLASYEKDNFYQLLNNIKKEKETLKIKITESWTLTWFVLKKELDLIEKAEISLKTNEKAYIQRGNNKLTLWDEVTIYIDPANPNNYRIDVDNYLYNR